MGKLGKTKLNINRLGILYSLGYNDAKIAKHLKYSKSTVTYVRKHILKYPLVLENITLTKDQEEILIGTLLGDSYIGYTHSGCRFPNLTFSHCKKQEIYAKTKFNKLRIIMSSIKERCYHTTTVIGDRKCYVQPVIFAIGHNCKCLIKYREIFYKNNKKIIPIDFLKDTFTAQSLAYLFMDDGCKNQKSYNLNLQGFEIDNLLEFSLFLKEKFNLEFTIKKDKTMYLRYKSINTLNNLISQYITEDMKYKIN